jgi:hypothetical protein
MPIDNAPESMPLNCNYTRIYITLLTVAATMALEEGYDRKFSTSNPNRLTIAYLKVWNCYGPKPTKIVEDLLKVGFSWEDIHQNKGGYVNNVPIKGKQKACQWKMEASLSAK